MQRLIGGSDQQTNFGESSTSINNPAASVAVVGKQIELINEMIAKMSESHRGPEQHHQEYKNQPNDYTNVAGRMIAPNHLGLQGQNLQFNQNQNAMNNILPNALMLNYMMAQQNQQALKSVHQQQLMWPTLPQAYPFPSGSQPLLQSNFSQQHFMTPHAATQQQDLRILPPRHPGFIVPLVPPRFPYDHQQFLSGANAAAATAAPAMFATPAISGQVQRDLCQVCNDKVICLLSVENFQINY